MNKLSLKYVKEKTADIAPGYECISKEYTNANTYLDFICDKNHPIKMRWLNFHKGHRCPVCSNDMKCKETN